MRILAHRPVQELDCAACCGDLLQKKHLVHIVAGQPVGCGDQDTIELAQRCPIAQPLQPGPLEARATVAVIAKHVLRLNYPALAQSMGEQAIELLGQAVGLSLTLGGDPRIDPDPHGSPPVREARGGRGCGRSLVGSRPRSADSPDPTGAARPDGVGARGAPATAASLPPAADIVCKEGSFSWTRPRKWSGNRHQLSLSCLKRLRQNLSFVIRPSKWKSS